MDRSLLVAFDTDDSEFARGVEVGILWQRMQTKHYVAATVHASNAEMIMRMAEHCGFSFSAESLNEDWLTVRLESR